MIRLLFQVQYEERPTHTLAVSGAIPQLGSWDVTKALRLRRSHRDPQVWHSQVDVPSIDFEYAYVLIRRVPDESDFWFSKKMLRLLGKARSEPVVCVTDEGLKNPSLDAFGGNTGPDTARDTNPIIGSFRRQLAIDFGLETSIPSDLQIAIITADTKVRHIRESWRSLNKAAEQLSSLETFFSSMHELKDRIESQHLSMARLAEDYAKEFAERRALVDQVQNLRGKVRVLVRIRPRLDSEAQQNCAIEGHIRHNRTFSRK